MTKIREIRNVRLQDSRRATIRINHHTIHSITAEQGWEPHLDANGAYAIPGLIDPHVHSRVPGDPQKEDWEHLTQAALCGGVTMVCDMPNTNPPTTTGEQLAAKCRKIGAACIAYRCWFGATSHNAREIESIARDPRIVGVKLYMAPTTGDLLVSKRRDQQHIFNVCAENNLPLAVHAENYEMMEQNFRLLGRQPLIADHCLIRNTEVEVSAVRRAIELAEHTGCRLYLCHLSTPESIEVAYDAKNRGKTEIYVETCPHFLFLCNSRLQNEAYPGLYKTNPPLRTSKQMGRMQEIVGCSGWVDCIGSDHAPHSPKEKQARVYDQVPSGVPGVQTILPLMLKLVRCRTVTLPQLVALTSGNAARILGLSAKGKIEPGSDADIVLFDPDEPVILNNEDMATKCTWTPFAKMHAWGTPRTVCVGGVIVYQRS